MKVKFLTALTIISLVIMCQQCQASLLGSMLSFDGNVDSIEDDSAGIFVDRDSDGMISENDLVQGFIEIVAVDGPGVPAGTSLIGVYSFEVKSVTLVPELVNSGGTTLSFHHEIELELPTALVDRLIGSGAGLLDVAGVDLSPLTSTVNGSADDAVLGILETTSGDFNIPGDFMVDSGSDLFPASSSELGGVINSDWSASLTAGLFGTNSHVITTTTENGNGTSPANIAYSSLSGGFAEFNATYSVVQHSFGSSVIFLPVANTALGFDGDISIEDGHLNSPNGASSQGFDFRDDGNYEMNAVPEPSSILVFLGLLICGCAAIIRARYRSA